MTMTELASLPRVAGGGAALEMHGVSKDFGGVAAVRDISFRIEAGEFLTMLGPSGSGKTTTLNMIAGFLQPDSGRITLEDRDITTTPAYRRNIGMVFQNYALFPHMSALRNIAFPLEMRGVSRREATRRAHEALELVELDRHASKMPKQLSGGQQQRVALARAFVYQPSLLLMDEPLGALDKRLREAMQIEIMHICRDLGSTVVYVTHDQEEALVMSDRIALYHDGRIEQIGTAEDLYEHPATVFVADFIGDSNILPGHLRPDVGIIGDGWVIPTGDTLSFGPEVVVIIRPEVLQVEVATDTETRPNSIRGVVTDIIYLGAENKYLVHTPSGQTLEVRRTRSLNTETVTRGQEVCVTWKHGDYVVLPRLPEAAPPA